METNGEAWTNSSTVRRRVSRGPGRCRLQTGQALLEVALVTPLLLALLVGAVELGRFAYIGILVGNAARAGAAYGAEGHFESVCNPPFPCGIQLAADNDFQSNGQSISNLTVTASDTCGCDDGGTITGAGCGTPTDPNPTAGSCTGSGIWVVMVTVTASGTFTPLFNYPGISRSITISRTATMRVAND